MDPVSWVILGAVIVLSAVGVVLWNRFGQRLARRKTVDETAAEVREARLSAERRLRDSKDAGRDGGRYDNGRI
ncbi:hypothetical protein EV187_1684 [Agromyces ramosus]|uniref:Uncharacterized protein n=1 Tax=Agromyces ramosus TaxID=33879 RepID=A0A4Q7MD60_9MICO|nr:hypothetical protein [Agromyces ramosus]RZS65974.1 hypothetical protein EV187_1684 [Agromyces ramosus]